MTENQTTPLMSKVRRRAHLKSMYFAMARADNLDTCFQEVVDDYDAGVLTGRRFEGSGLIVVGESGAGKSFEIDHAFARWMENAPTLECGREKRFIQFALVGETTWKALGLQIANDLDYTMSPKLTEHVIWARVREKMQQKGIWFLHIDECQHLFQTLGATETKKTLNAMKTLMKHREWPVALVLSGIPELLDKVFFDPQLREIMSPYVVEPFDPMSDDLHEIDSAFYHYAEAVGVNIDAVRDGDTLRRLCFGMQDLYGRAFRFMIRTLSNLPLGETEMTIDHL
jgi:hypothetical protein